MKMRHLHTVPIQSTTSLCEQLGFTVSAEFLESLDLKPALKTGIGTYWYRHDVGHICTAISNHMRRLVNEYIDN